MLASGRFALGHALIHRDGFEDVANEIADLAMRRAAPAMVVTPNADHVLNLEHDAELRAAYARADLVVPDGMPVVWASRLLGTPAKERVTGADLMPRLCAIAARNGLKVFLLGGAEGVAERARDNLVQADPGLMVVGTASPPLGFERDAHQNAAIVRAVRDSDADLVFVCLGSPKQEVWISRHIGRFDKGVFLGVGAAIDFCAGTVARAPRWMRRAGLEWCHRLLQEPRRFAGRYARDLGFFAIVARQAWRQSRAAPVRGKRP